MIRFFLSLAVATFLVGEVFAQSTFRVRNNTWQDFNVAVSQTGPTLIDNQYWSMDNDTVLGWWETNPSNVFTAARSSAVLALGEVANYEIRLQGAQDTLVLHMLLEGVANGTTMQYGISGPGFATPLTSTSGFNDVVTSLAGKSVFIRFIPDNEDTQLGRDVFFTIHDYPIYELAAQDFTNPNIMNVMFFNIQMLPFGVSGMGQPNDRASLLPAQISPYQDVVVFEEIFDNGPRQDHLIPAMTAAGFPYRTEVLNPNNTFLPIPWNGGVMIFSRWPIELEADYDFALCGQASQDCLANKGIKYARVNKLGKRYHIFGTHMDAGGEADDILAKRTQMGEIRDFIDVQNIPDGEPVIFGGDFNVAPTHELNLYQAMLDSIGPYIPHSTGYHNSTFSGPFGKIIDNSWGDRSHLVALESTQKIITMRSIEPVLLQLGEFSDHRCALGRFVFPDITMVNKGDTILCPGANYTLEMDSDIPVSYQWMKDGDELVGETASSLSIVNGLETQSGAYSCVVRYEVVYGNVDDALTQVFYPNGIDTVRSAFSYDFGQVTISQALCEVGVGEVTLAAFNVYPNPTEGSITVRMANATASADLRVTDMMGRVVMQSTFTGNNLLVDMGQLPSGIYTVGITVGSHVAQQRLALLR